MKNPEASAVKRDEEDWGKRGRRMTTTRYHFTFRVDTWTPDGESIVEHIAGVEDYQVALATYRVHRSLPREAPLSKAWRGRWCVISQRGLPT
jgi:hypothetical protein